MDIENMHPFCLPFGLCHDATSSTVEAAHTSATNPNNNNNNNNNVNMNNNNDKDRTRSKSASPSEELLIKHLNSSSLSTSSAFNQHSLLNDDCDLISSSLLDHQVGSFYSLELDDIEDCEEEKRSTTDIDSSSFSADQEEPEDDLMDLLKSNHHLGDPNDWYCSQYSLFSPELVTSSSSPLASSQLPVAGNENRHIDNKLKENIDYLTSLFCPANQPPVPAGPAHTGGSYTALTKSLSTGPKLLERPHQAHPLGQNRSGPMEAQQLLPAPHFKPMNEALPCGQLLLQPAVKRPYAGPQNSDWQPYPKMAPAGNVESSVSAADSTGSDSRAHMQQPFSELKVLSSLLTTNKQQQQQQQQQPQIKNSGWQPHQTNQNNQNCEQSDRPNGKPITLTPIAPNCLSLIQQSAPEKKLFAEPASSTDPPAPNGLGATAPPQTPTVVLLGELAATQQPISRPAGGTNKKQQAAIHKPISRQPAGSKNSNRANRPSSLSTDCSVSSHDDGLSTSQIDQEEAPGNEQGESDSEEDVDSDDESFYGDYTNSDLIGASISDNAENKWTLNMGRTRRNGQKRYFWQYNVQSKGPKGTRICATDDSEDPFVLPEASDPVFSNDCQIEGVKHSGKARRGDGNDLTPNPKKLLMIGLELKKLGKIINELAPVSDLPVNARNKTRKEKNKLASRACRLKKKAQHEANKIKLYGLQQEHQQVVLGIYDIKKLLGESLVTDEGKADSNRKQLVPRVGAIADGCSMNVAGQTSDYVNSVLEKVVSGCIDGGLQT